MKISNETFLAIFKQCVENVSDDQFHLNDFENQNYQCDTFD